MRWIVGFTLMIVVFGTIFGLVLGGLNPWTSPAEANRINMQTEHQQAVYQLEERLANAQTEAEIQEIQREQELLNAQYEHDKQILVQDLEHRAIAFRTWMTVLTFVGGALSIAIVIASIFWFGSKAVAKVRSAPVNMRPMPTPIPSVEKSIRPMPERVPYEPLESPQRRYERRIAERLEELADKKEDIAMISRMKAVLDPAKMSKEQYNKRPLAGD